MNAPTACPHIDFGMTSSITYQGDSTGLPNWVESPRLEWQDAPDDSLRFTAPTGGNYVFSLTAEASDASNFDKGISVRNYVGVFYGACPSAGIVQSIDGIYEVPTFPVALTAGQQVLMYVSAPYWAVEKSGRYMLTITKQ